MDHLPAGFQEVARPEFAAASSSFSSRPSGGTMYMTRSVFTCAVDGFASTCTTPIMPLSSWNSRWQWNTDSPMKSVGRIRMTMSIPEAG